MVQSADPDCSLLFAIWFALFAVITVYGKKNCSNYRIIIHFYLHSCIFPEFDWLTDYIHFVIEQNMVVVLLLQKMFSCL